MVLNIAGYRVFIASPGGLIDERNAFKETLHQYSEDESMERNVSFIPMGWEETLGGQGRPQEIINKEIKKCDFFVLLLWDRWGSPPSAKEEGQYTSGTEEEFYVALDCIKNEELPMKQIVALFKGIDDRQLSDPGLQLQKVLQFKRSLEAEKKLLYKSFDSIDEFRRIIRRHLSKWVREDEENRLKKPAHDLDIKRKAYKSSPAFEIRNLASRTARELANEAQKLADSGNITDAETLFAHAVVGRNDLYAINRYGKFLRRVSRVDYAQAMFERVHSMASKSEDKEELANAFSNLGIIYRRKGELDNALAMHEESNKIASEMGAEGRRTLSYNFGNIGHILEGKNDLEGAENMYREALKIDSELNSMEGQAYTYGNLGLILHKRNLSIDAVRMLQKGIDIAKKSGESGLRPLAYSCGRLGLVLLEMNQLEEAKKVLEQALSINKKNKHEQGKAFNLSLLARYYLGKNDLEQATITNEKALKINININDLKGRAYNYLVKGKIYLKGKDTVLAKEYLLKSLGEFKKKSFQRGIADYYEAMGHYYFKAGKNTSACESWQNALKIYSELKISNVMNNLKKELSKICETCGKCEKNILEGF